MKHFKGIIIIIFAISNFLLLSSCVSQNEYNSLQDKYNALQASSNVTEAKLVALQGNYYNLQAISNNLSEELAISKVKEKALINTQNELIQESLKAQNRAAKADKTIQLYKDTFGTVNEGTDPSYISGNRPIKLLSNPNATDPTWDQLKAFLLRDTTDQTPYKDGIYECGNYANDLYNNAQNSGIRCAFVVLRLGASLHAINAFKTTDKGLVYIDDTGIGIPAVHPLGSTGNTMPNNDKLAQLKPGSDLYESFIFPDLSKGWTIETRESVSNIEIYW